MNALEELIENYKYNGVVSLKAFEDDIATLENQIETYQATKEELKLRNRNTASISERIQAAKGKLALLKSAYRRASEERNPDEVVIDAVRVSANDARETEMPETAAGNKTPKRQNFESADLETREEVVNEMETVDSEEVKHNDIPPQPTIEDYREPLDSVTEEPYYDSGGIIFGTPIQQDEPEECPTTIITEQEEREDKISRPTDTQEPGPKDNDIVLKEEMVEKEMKAGEIIDENAVPQQTTSTTAEELNDGPENESVEKEKDVEKNVEYVNTENGLVEVWKKAIIKNRLTDDYTAGLKDENNPIINDTTVPLDNIMVPFDNEEINPAEIPIPDVEYDYDDGVRVEDWPGTEFDASFDLSSYTGKINTKNVRGYYATDTRELNIVFDDSRDYSIFLDLLKEYMERRNIFKKLAKKPKSIFMFVREKRDVLVVREYKFEFCGCRVVYAHDDDFDHIQHESMVTFKYKKLKIS